MTIFRVSRSFRLFSELFSDKSLTKKAYLNAVAAAVDFGARLVVGFVITPYLVAGLGDFLYGTWLVLRRLTGYLTAASGRPTQALKMTIANQQSSTDFEEKRRNVGSALIVWFLFLPILTTLGGVLVWFVPIWLDIPQSRFGIVRLAAALLVIKLIIATLAAVPRSVLEGENMGYKRMGLSGVLVIVGGGLTVLALYLNTGLVGVAAAGLTEVLLTGLLFLLVVRSYVPWFGVSRPKRLEIRRFFGLSWWFLTWRLVMRLMTAADVVIIGIFASVEMVAIYSLTKYAPEILVSLVAIMLRGVDAGLGGIIGAGNLAKAARVRGEVMLLSWLAITIAGSTILLWNQVFIELWVGTEYFAGPATTLLIVVMIAQFVLIRNDANIIDLTLDLSRKVLIGACSAIMSVVIAVVLVSNFNAGIAGMVLGFIIGRSILTVIYPLLIGRYLNVSPYSQLKGVLRPVLVTVFFFWLSSYLRASLNGSAWLSTDTWAGLIVLVCSTVGVVSLLAFNIGLTAGERRRLLRRVQMILSNVSN